jgi:hypothetical protein
MMQTAVAPVGAPPIDQRRSGMPTAAIVSLAALGALVIGGAFALAVVALRSSTKSTTVPTTFPTTVAPTTTPPSSTAVSASSTTTTATTTVATTPPTTRPVTTTIRVLPPTTTVPFDTGRQGVTSAQASALLRKYFLTAGARKYGQAWAMCTERYQAKYVSYEKFVSFWDRIAVVGIDGTSFDGETQSGGAVLLADVWFEGTNGKRSNEAIRIEVVGEGDSLWIDDYTFLRSR